MCWGSQERSQTPGSFQSQHHPSKRNLQRDLLGDRGGGDGWGAGCWPPHPRHGPGSGRDSAGERKEGVARENSWGQGLCREIVGQGEVKCCPQGSTASLSLSPWAEAPGPTPQAGSETMGSQSWGGVAARSIELILTCSFSS